jgi:hypothetical protein
MRCLPMGIAWLRGTRGDFGTSPASGIIEPWNFYHVLRDRESRKTTLPAIASLRLQPRSQRRLQARWSDSFAII